MAKRRKKGGWSPGGDDEGGGFAANPFADALAGMERAPAPPAAADPAIDAQVPPDAAEPDVPKRAVVRKERKGRGGKTVTVISHLGLGSDELQRWCKSLRKTLGCGGSVEGDDVILQGDQTARAADELRKRGIGKVSG